MVGTLFGYSLYGSVVLLSGFAAYRLLLAKGRYGSMNRWVIMTIYAVALLAMPIAECVASLHLPAVGKVEIGEAIAVIVTNGERAEMSTITLMSMVLWIYLIGVGVVAVKTAIGLIRLRQLIAAGERVEYDGYRVVLLPGCRSPFSFGRTIVIAPGEEDADVVIAHESAHVGQNHWTDLLLATAVCALMWYNPAAWLLRRELRDIHEYLADDMVIRSGIDAVRYQKILIKKAIGTRLQPFTNSLNQSNIYKRITMMYKKSPSGASRLRVLGLVPALLAAVAVCGSSPVASAVSTASIASLSNASQTEAKVTQISSTEQTGGISLPKFVGGEAEMIKFLSQSIKYPEAAMKDGIQGKVVVRFTVGTDGSISDPAIVKSVSPELDSEAIRVVSSMPRWIPGYDKDANPVKVQYTVPVNFVLSDK